VRWLFGEQREDHQLNVDRVEFAPAGKIAACEVVHKSKASTTESAAPVMVSVSSSVFSVAFANVFAAEGAIETR
jgi:hypothetical protein